MTNNPMAMMMRNQMVHNPQQFAQNALKSGYFNNNSMYKNVLEAVARNDTEAMKEIAGNVCKEHNVSVEDATIQYKQYYGLK